MVAISRSSDTESLLQFSHRFTPHLLSLHTRYETSFLTPKGIRAAVALLVQPPCIVGVLAGPKGGRPVRFLLCAH